jgi:hypothetical protein
MIEVNAMKNTKELDRERGRQGDKEKCCHMTLLVSLSPCLPVF